jgi:hypothetical protein
MLLLTIAMGTKTSISNVLRIFSISDLPNLSISPMTPMVMTRESSPPRCFFTAFIASSLASGLVASPLTT